MMNIRLVFLGALLFFASQSARADLDFLGQIGLHGGGDNVVTVLFTDGTTEDLKAGEFLTIDLGIAWDMGIMEGRITGGWKYDTITAANGDIDFTRYTGQALLLFAAGDWRFGGGAAYHFGIKLDGSGAAAGADANFDDAMGYVAEIDYYFSDSAYVGVQYLDIEYDRNTDFGQTPATFDASSIGIVFAGRW